MCPNSMKSELLRNSELKKLTRTEVWRTAIHGTQGSQGIQVSQGTQASQGTQRSQGFQGTQGTQGCQGWGGF
jgi:hypothetical protein